MVHIERKGFIKVLFLALCYFAIFHGRHFLLPKSKTRSRALANVPRNAALPEVLPRIMMWTPLYSNWENMFNDTSIRNILKKNCSANCLITDDPRLVQYSEAVVFHVRKMAIDNLPSKRHKWQKWVFFLMESPPHTRFIHFNHTHNMFNWTMTYRRDSDIYVPYGRLLPCDANAACPNRDLKDLWESKNKTAVWVVSNCFTDGGREDFVAELRKYIDVDVYGSCGEYECPKTREDACYAELQRTYFYALAFENSVCVDYVTEKFYNALRHYIIPVVFGGANYNQIAPHHSYIDALGFHSPKHLAEYLVKLSKNYTEYVSYFTWKSRHDIALWDRGFCELCVKLHDRVEFQRPSSYEDVASWWFGKGGHCRSWDGVQSTPPERAKKRGRWRLTYSRWLQGPSTRNTSKERDDLQRPSTINASK